MGLFSKKKSSDQTNTGENWQNAPELPKLPSLPELPSLPQQKYDEEAMDPYEVEMPQALPSLPSNSIGEQISRSAIKDAISGGNGGEIRSMANDRERYRDGMQKTSSRTREFSESEDSDEDYEENSENVEQEYTPREEVPYEFRDAARKITDSRPVFVRIDKFQEALKTFEQTKDKINEIEKMLREIQNIKAQEERELSEWDMDLQALKNKIEKVNQDLFSKIE